MSFDHLSTEELRNRLASAQRKLWDHQAFLERPQRRINAAYAIAFVDAEAVVLSAGYEVTDIEDELSEREDLADA